MVHRSFRRELKNITEDQNSGKKSPSSSVRSLPSNSSYPGHKKTPTGKFLEKIPTNASSRESIKAPSESAPSERSQETPEVAYRGRESEPSKWRKVKKHVHIAHNHHREHEINLDNPTTWLEKQIMKKNPPKSNHRPLPQPEPHRYPVRAMREFKKQWDHGTKAIPKRYADKFVYPNMRPNNYYPHTQQYKVYQVDRPIRRYKDPIEWNKW